MKLIVFSQNNDLRLGIVTTDGVIDVLAAGETLAPTANLPDSVNQFYLAGLDYLDSLKQLAEATSGKTGDWLLTESDLTIGPIVPQPGKILCIGLNYRHHAEESGMPVPTTPIIFSKFNNAVAASNENIPLPAMATQYDYEAELVVVMGKRAVNVREADALNYVLGYCNGNDISARDLQTRTSQWLLGKTLDKFFPIGPYLVTSDELTDPANLNIKGWYNGELRQSSNTGDLVFSVEETISYISRHFTLEAGDVIATGTPAGVILGHENPEWMKAGDHYKIEIDGLGTLENRMVQG